MLGGVLCARPKDWLLSSLSFVHAPAAAHHRLTSGTPIKLVVTDTAEKQRQRRLRHHSSACQLGCEAGGAGAGGAGLIWHAIFPAGGLDNRSQPAFCHHDQKGEGSWNVAWDARPARWLHRPDSAWLLFGVCACLAAPLEIADVNSEAVAVVDDNADSCTSSEISTSDDKDESSDKFRVTGVPADGRCLFRAIAHVASLRNGEEAPDEHRQTQLADELRAKVVDELLRRRKETEWFIEGDFDAYVVRIQQPHVWGGEPELLMASHVLKTSISVFMLDRSSGSYINIANYGEEYQKDDKHPISLLFHGYGHYDILESISEQRNQIAGE